MKAALHVSSNLATSLDGKIATASREFFALGTPADRKLMQVLRRKSDVVVFGATTLRTFRRPCIVYGTTAKGLKHQPANAVVSNSLEGISPDWPFFLHDGFKRLLFVGSKARSSNSMTRKTRRQKALLPSRSSPL
jgi:riboflavin biosynthesis pyrimidine reductase